MFSCAISCHMYLDRAKLFLILYCLLVWNLKFRTIDSFFNFYILHNSSGLLIDTPLCVLPTSNLCKLHSFAGILCRSHLLTKSSNYIGQCPIIVFIHCCICLLHFLTMLCKNLLRFVWWMRLLDRKERSVLNVLYIHIASDLVSKIF